MYDGIPDEEYINLKDVIATYLLQRLPTDSFTKAVLDSDSELVEEIAEFGAYDTMSRDETFESCSQFLLGRSFVSESDPNYAQFDKDLKAAYSVWASKNP